MKHADRKVRGLQQGRFWRRPYALPGVEYSTPAGSERTLGAFDSVWRLLSWKGGRGKGLKGDDKASVLTSSMVFGNCLIFQYVLSFVLQKPGSAALCFQDVLSFVLFGHPVPGKKCRAESFPPAFLGAPSPLPFLSSLAECHIISLAQEQAVVKRKMGGWGPGLGVTPPSWRLPCRLEAGATP